MEDFLRYTVGLIAQTPTEFKAAIAILDEDYGPLFIGNERYMGHGGRYADHDVVIIVQMHLNHADELHMVLCKWFPSMEHTISTGTSIGVREYEASGCENKICLGDVVVAGNVFRDHPYIYDENPDRDMSSYYSLRETIDALRLQHIEACSVRIPVFLRKIGVSMGGNDSGILPNTDFKQDVFTNDKGTKRSQRPPKIHYRDIYVGRELSSEQKQEFRKENSVVCFEEGYHPLRTRSFPDGSLLAIRGIYDYTNSEKKSTWHSYAAATAIAYTKELVEALPPITTLTRIYSKETNNESGICGICRNLSEDPRWDNMASISIIQLNIERGNCPTGGCQVLLNAVRVLLPNEDLTSNELNLYFYYQRDDHYQVYVVRRSNQILELFTRDEPKHPTWTSISKIEAHEDLASSDSLLFAKDMIKNCQENHDRCKPIAQEDPFMPRRILDLGTFDPSATTLAETMPVTLVETIHISPFEPYVTLSHRWGPPGTTITTLSQNIESHKSQSGIAFEKLSVAFQDTVYILRRLGIRYLWIDSLCIIQHDLEDWREQSKSMAKIYDRALFTIAWQCGHGKSIRNLRIPYQLTDVRSAVPVFARLKTEHLYGERRTKYFPLLSRGWVYQERLLSRRTLHVTERELMWRCREQLSCQCTCARREVTRTYDDHSSETIYARWLDGISKGGEGQQERALEENWQKMITEYSDLKLTKQYDRLVAIQGCADQIQRISGQQYFKGLWRKSFIQGMTWYKRSAIYDKRNPELLSEPTWSWGSVKGQVQYYWDTNREFAQLLSTNSSAEHCGVISSQCVKLRGYVIPARIWIGKPRRCRNVSHIDSIEIALGYVKEKTDTMYTTWYITPDFDMRSTAPSTPYDIQLFLLAGWGKRYMVQYYFLVIWDYGKMIPGSGGKKWTKDHIPIYQRIGLCSHGGEGINFEKAEEVVIAIE